MRMLTHEMRRGTLVLHLSGDLDHHCAGPLRGQIDRLLDSTRAHRVVLDLSGLGFMDSSGIGLILGRYRLLEQRGARLLLRPGGERVDRMLKLAGLYELMDREEVLP